MQKRHKTSTEVAHFYAATWTHFTLRLTDDFCAARTEGFNRDFAGKLICSKRPVDSALGITIAGFSKQFQHLKPILHAFDPSPGFIGKAIKVSQKAQDKALWAEHWVNEMWGTDNPEGFWLNLNLAAKIIDARCEYDRSIYRTENKWRSFASLFTRGRKNRIKKLRKERAKTLYGSENPKDIFYPAIRFDPQKSNNTNGFVRWFSFWIPKSADL